MSSVMCYCGFSLMKSARCILWNIWRTNVNLNLAVNMVVVLFIDFLPVFINCISCCVKCLLAEVVLTKLNNSYGGVNFV